VKEEMGIRELGDVDLEAGFETLRDVLQLEGREARHLVVDKHVVAGTTARGRFLGQPDDAIGPVEPLTSSGGNEFTWRKLIGNQAEEAWIVQLYSDAQPMRAKDEAEGILATFD
jgi:hypothetical protein